MAIVAKDFSASPFEQIKHIDEKGFEFWYARELQIILNYKQWRRFNDVILLAQENLETVVESVIDHIAPIGKMVNRPQGGGINQADYKLSRLAGYHVALSCDSRGNDAVKMAKHYFAVKTRQAELFEALPPAPTTLKDDYLLVSAMITDAFATVPLKPELLGGLKINAAIAVAPHLAYALEESRQLLITNTAQECELLTVTAIGKRLDGLSARKVNQMLIDKGFQIKNPNKKSSKDSSYLPTPLGSEFSDLTLATGSNGSGTFQQLRWYSSIVDQLV